jgi:hypothetical protein
MWTCNVCQANNTDEFITCFKCGLPIITDDIDVEKVNIFFMKYMATKLYIISKNLAFLTILAKIFLVLFLIGIVVIYFSS